LQKGDREKLSMEFINNVMTSTGKSNLSVDAVKNFENAKTAVEQTGLLLKEFESDPNLFKSWGGPGDSRGQQIKFIRNNLSDTIGRLRSGGAINDEESKTFRSFVPDQGFLKGRMEDKETVIFKMKTLHKLFQGIMDGIQPASEASNMVKRIQEAIDEGHSLSEISKYIGN
jgi:hypothetical protein